MVLLRKSTGFPSLWEDFFDNDGLTMPGLIETGRSIPAVNIKDNTDDYQIEMAAPGMTKDDFHVNLENNVLTIEAESKMEDEKEDDTYTRKEFSYRSFKRSFTLPESAEAEKIEASYDNGVLHINIPKKEEAKPKPPKVIEIM